MIEPPPVSIIRGIAWREVSTMLFRFKVMILSQSSRAISVTRSRWLLPTLLSSMSSRPYSETAKSTSALHSSSLRTSAANAEAIPPSASISASVSLARSIFISPRTTFAPSRANNVAVAFPLPIPSLLEPAPVTIATFPSSRGRRSFIYESPKIDPDYQPTQ